MKRGTPDHPKVYELALALKVRRVTAIGHLELLFHFTSQYAPQGNIGKFSDKRIAAALDWHKRPEIIIDALVSTGWVDPHSDLRLCVHDWNIHCDRTTLQRLARVGLVPISISPTANGCEVNPRLTQDRFEVDPRSIPGLSEVNPGLVSDQPAIHPVDTSSTAKQNQPVTANVCTQSETNNRTPPVPMPLPLPLPEPEPLRRLPTSDLSPIAKRIFDRHPLGKKTTPVATERALAQRVMDAVNPQAQAELLETRHAGWCASEQWQDAAGRYAPKLDRWLISPDSDAEPPPPTRNSTSRKPMTAYERVMAEAEAEEKARCQ